METRSDRVALVTGGSRGIGAAIVQRLAREGVRVAFTYVNGKDKAEALVRKLAESGANAFGFQADNSRPGEITAVLEEVNHTWGKLDILVNNAGIYIGKPFAEHTLEEYEQTMAVNVRAVVEACLHAARRMENYGRIITIGSNMADRVAAPQGTLYSMSKSALIGLTKGLARDLGPRGITVNLVQPGSTNTDMNPENTDHADFQRSLMAIPTYGKPEQIADLLAYLINPASGFTTGGVFTIDGGMNC
ncbi:3-oxoacyl-ACP reductase FabG [Larkinella knui]|uniref:SDR family oxidoreductase n=1 Tax=Larkinella knui TaxID=2025310 RepID=A0A3P1CAZ1_9BACT|nr:SDR family oxidoreductase [Larkinella knui]RRB10428.1 SDR family oxidoreductase [Larkinella knui]